MAGAAITFNLSELPGLESALAAARARALDLHPLMDQIGMAMETTTHERFTEERAPDGKPWAPTIRKREEGGQILRDKGHLDNSITHLASSDSVEIGSNLIYARPHQDGATIRAKGGGKLKFALPGSLGFRSIEQVIIPARPYLGLGGDDELTIEELAEDYLAGELAE